MLNLRNSQNSNKPSLAIFGATGNVGQQAAELLASENPYKVKVLTGDHNYQLLAKTAIALQAESVVIKSNQYAAELKSLLSGTNVKVSSGESALQEAAFNWYDIALMAISGTPSLPLTSSLIKSGTKNIALASKEAIVCGGHLLMQQAKDSQTNIIPLDSEHHSLAKLMCNKSELASASITASGGPFLNRTWEQLEDVKISEALKHPTWVMGKKITIDSATLFNKVLELIEAYYLFDLQYGLNLEAIIHPQSFIHANAVYKDGSSKSIGYYPDMKVPISSGLGLNHQSRGWCGNTLDFFPAKGWQKEVLAMARYPHHSQHIAINIFNEKAVMLFLEGKISFREIITRVQKAVYALEIRRIYTIEEIMDYAHSLQEIII